jgi:acyl CoA:acetate/3-ketoacid CoA transferase alpha subunit/acyl CoA:acetate/3-ketoacid CoA transferase beta subunit
MREPVDVAALFEIPRNEGTSKLMSLADAVRTLVSPGDVIHVAYSDARPNAAIMELVRAFAGRDPGFTVVTAGMVNIQHALVELGLVRRLVASFAGENYPVARPNPALVRAVREQRVTIEHWSLWSLIARLNAAALGVPYFPVRSLRDSDIGADAAARGEYLEVGVAGQEEPVGLVSALRPDVVLVHGAAADEHGNVVLAAPYGEGQAGALAARRGVIATVERLVSTAEIREMSRLTRIPAHVVRAVCVVPFGAHPYGFNNPNVPGIASYTEDEQFVSGTLRASRTPEGFRDWIDEWVLGVGSHDGYLARLGQERLGELSTPRPEPNAAEILSCIRPNESASGVETQIAVTARRLASATRARGLQAVLSGVGLSNLAAWLGVIQLRQSGVDVELMAEIGLFGYAPRPGEPFIFAGQNVPTSKVLTDVMGVLGTYVSGPGTRSIGLIGAGQIDRTGAVNSTYSDDGDFLVGSGGANDVLSAADEVIITVANEPHRLVDKVAYRTCPGDRVRTIVTDLGVFDKADGGFILTALLPAAGADTHQAVELIRSRTGWFVEVSRSLEREASASSEELAMLRMFDPKQLFLADRRTAVDPVPATNAVRS